jgi:hypothetical protein
MITQKPATNRPQMAVEFQGPPPEIEAEATRARQERARKNSQWLQTHWDQLLPQALGKFVAVAGEEAFIADTPQQAWASAAQKHPQDDTVIVQYVNPRPGLKVYAHRG